MLEKVCILYGKNNFTAIRLEEVLTINGFLFQFSKDFISLKNLINKHNKNLLCIFIEIENNEESIKSIEYIKKLSLNVPLIVLSDDPKRELFIKVMLAGATDFIVKPFDDSVLLSRISLLIESLPEDNFNNNDSAIELIRIELKKSKKGNYPVTFGLITFYKLVKEYSAVLEHQYRKELPEAFADLGKRLFDTDVKQLVGSQCMLVAFNFCEGMKIPNLERRIKHIYSELKNEHALFKDYMMSQVFFTEYANEFQSEHILNTLMRETKNTIEEQRGKFFP